MIRGVRREPADEDFMERRVLHRQACERRGAARRRQVDVIVEQGKRTGL